jgi:oligosaccharide repeat unit polymerase
VTNGKASQGPGLAARRPGTPGSRLPSGRRWGWAAIPVVATIMMGAVASERNLPVLGPLLVMLWIAAVFYGSLRGQARTAVIEIGTVYTGIVVLYALFPLVAYLVNGLEYTPTNDSRLFAYQPLPREVAGIAWLYVLHLASFVAVYRIVRGRVAFRPQNFRLPGRVRTISLVSAFLALVAYFWLLGLAFDLSASDYSETYLLYARLPQLVAQVTNHLGGIRFTVGVALLTILFANFRKFRWWIAAALVGVAAVTFLRLRSRTEFVLLFVAAAILYHWLVRPISERGLLTAGAAVTGLFLVAGVLRGGILRSEYAVGWNFFAYINEFEVLFGNAYDVAQLKADGLIDHLPLGFVLSDVFALVPQQLLPAVKVNPADWYVNRFYPEFAAGGAGLAFGTLSESILFGGWLGVVLRASGLGLILAFVHRWCATRRASFWPIIIYLWATLQIYQAFRSTTFCLVAFFVYRVMPLILFVEISRSLGRSTEAKAVRGARPGQVVPGT